MMDNKSEIANWIVVFRLIDLIILSCEMLPLETKNTQEDANQNLDLLETPHMTQM